MNSSNIIFHNKTKQERQTKQTKQQQRPTTLECKHLGKLYQVINDIPMTVRDKSTKSDNDDSSY